MKKISCASCGKRYDCDADGFCPRCGAFNQPAGDGDAPQLEKKPALLGLLGALDVLVGDEVIQNDVHPGLVENIAKARLFKLVDGHRYQMHI